MKKSTVDLGNAERWQEELEENIRQIRVSLPYRSWTLSRNQRLYLPLKRLLDIVLSFTALVLLSPLFLIIAVLIKVTTHGPILFKQTRVGRSRQLFTIFKFRSMYLSAPPNLSTAQFDDMDGYITPLGKVLRKTSLDELPQLINVFLGQMSLVGYRPLIFKEVEIDNMRNQAGVYSIKPGITGYAQVNGRDNLTDPEKLAFDQRYLKNFSLLTDVKIFFQTFAVVIKHKDVKG
ncbi:MAG: sugar transferase [Oscillospiraceae bacterium]|nr:sugar transferase [Oscillospiraceae bacterium]